MKIRTDHFIIIALLRPKTFQSLFTSITKEVRNIRKLLAFLWGMRGGSRKGEGHSLSFVIIYLFQHLLISVALN